MSPVAKKKRRAPREIARVVRKKKKSNRVVRMLRGLFPNACGTGQARIEQYAGLTLQQAWRKASREDLIQVMRRARVQIPKPYQCATCKGDPTCTYRIPLESEKARGVFKGKVPKELVALFNRVKK